MENPRWPISSRVELVVVQLPRDQRLVLGLINGTVLTGAEGCLGHVVVELRGQQLPLLVLAEVTEGLNLAQVNRFIKGCSKVTFEVGSDVDTMILIGFGLSSQSR